MVVKKILKYRLIIVFCYLGKRKKEKMQPTALADKETNSSPMSVFL
tara:strand:+ start:407 stop:544 length:138 start_codon:yes stop_codon:yes gene_type:complete